MKTTKKKKGIAFNRHVIGCKIKFLSDGKRIIRRIY